MNRRWWIGVAIVAVLAGGSGRAEVVDRIIATVDGDPITAHELTTFREERGTAEMTDKQLLDAIIIEFHDTTPVRVETLLEKVRGDKARLRLTSGSALAFRPTATDHDGVIAELRQLLQTLGTS